MPSPRSRAKRRLVFLGFLGLLLIGAGLVGGCWLIRDTAHMYPRADDERGIRLDSLPRERKMLLWAPFATCALGAVVNVWATLRILRSGGNRVSRD
jgi:hypothetical protein